MAHWKNHMKFSELQTHEFAQPGFSRLTLFPPFSGFPRCSSHPPEEGEKGRKRAKKVVFGRSPGRAARHPLNPHLLHPHLRQRNTGQSFPARGYKKLGVSVPIWLVITLVWGCEMWCVQSMSFRPTQVELCKFGCVWSSLKSWRKRNWTQQCSHESAHARFHESVGESAHESCLFLCEWIPYKGSTHVLTWVLTRELTQVYMKWFGRVSPGLFSLVPFLSHSSRAARMGFFRKKGAHKLKRIPTGTPGGTNRGLPAGVPGFPVICYRETDRKGPFCRDTGRVSQGHPAIQGIFTNFMWFFIMCLFCFLVLPFGDKVTRGCGNRDE